MTRRALLFLAAAAAVPAAGCGGPDGHSPPAPDFGSADGKQIAELVSELNEAKANPQRFRAVFAAPAPTNGKAYDAFNFDVSGRPTVSGAQATATVKVRSDADQSERGEKEWTFVKEGDKWKIKDAPLP
jgi:hypothetical protein